MWSPCARKPDSQEWLSHSCVGAVAFFVFFAGAAGARVVAADFGAGTDGLGCFGLPCAGLILQLFFLALLFALHVAREPRQAGGNCVSTGSASGSARDRRGR